MKKTDRTTVFSILGLLTGMLIFQSCPEHEYYWYIDNNSSDTLSVYIAFAFCPTVYPDTVMSDDMTFGGYISPGTKAPVRPTLLDWKQTLKELPKDTLSVYIISTDTMWHYTWQEIKENYKVLVRYDLGVPDIEKLLDNNGFPTIPYPPDERMKDIKMYPPYGTYSE
ncbi:hypothetical protein FACS189429_5100 [Bacteroidia bacterium]|nr:hypothetical protein FACS189429_5100 [Bacteroidia bacterium]